MSELMHYGTPRHSGRYPWGSGDNPYQHESDFLNSYRKLSDQGLSEKDIAEYFGMSTTELRNRKTYERAQAKSAQYALAVKLSNDGYSNVAIAEQLGISEGTVRNMLKESVEEKTKIIDNVSDVLKENVATQKYIDVGTGANLYLGVSEQKLNSALQKLQDEEGYVIHPIKIEQVGNPGKYTTIKVLAPPGTEYADILRDIYSEKAEIGTVGDFYTNDGGRTFLGIETPANFDSSRLAINYKEDGGDKLDGVIYIRPGVEDISLGNANYAQVRIAVDGTHYMKGMAMYSNDLPDGVDIMFNTNKSNSVSKLDVLKPLKNDPDNPFGSTLRMEDGRIVGQRHYIDENGKEQLSPINIVRQEGDWDTWSDTLSSQFLAKQPKQLIKQQLDKTLDDKKSQYDTIESITQPEVRKKLLLEFAEDCDASASHLKAAALPRQSSKVILPLNDISEKEIYAPTYRNGEQVALVRYPHGGTFEIPILTVNNGKVGKDILGNAVDAVGINSKVAARLSGADFDGDTVVVIPTANQKIKSTSPLSGLKDFDPKESYPKVDGMKLLSKRQKQIEMGKVSNLITDMTIKGAKEDEIVRAVKHSMVVIDAEKHKLNYKQSEIDNGIEELKLKYQRKDNGRSGGVSTLISRAGHEVQVPNRKERIDKETGEKIFDYDHLKDSEKYKTKYKTTKDGEKIKYKVERTISSDLMRETKDAKSLSSGTIVENLYADYANNLKSMANKARKEAINTKNTSYSPSAKETYKNEVASLNSKLNIAEKNKPRERKAQVMANVTVSAKKRSNPDMDKDDLKKIKVQALASARQKVGASRRDVYVNVSDKEWEAMMSGALSSSKINRILSNMNPDKVKQLALPRSSKSLSSSQISRINNLSNSGYTISQIADSIGVSTSTVSNYLLKEGDEDGK